MSTAIQRCLSPDDDLARVGSAGGVTSATSMSPRTCRSRTSLPAAWAPACCPAHTTARSVHP